MVKRVEGVQQNICKGIYVIRSIVLCTYHQCKKNTRPIRSSMQVGKQRAGRAV